jgi:short-subunit dehydrogenase
MVARDTAGAGGGKVLITGSIAGFIPGSFQAVYNGTKAFVDSFADAIRNELKESKGVTITTLMPGPVETEFFDRADMLDTNVGASESKSDPADVARDGWEALMRGDAHIVSGWKNKIQAAAAHVTPAAVLAEQHRKMAEPGSATGD